MLKPTRIYEGYSLSDPRPDAERLPIVVHATSWTQAQHLMAQQWNARFHDEHGIFLRPHEFVLYNVRLPRPQ